MASSAVFHSKWSAFLFKFRQIEFGIQILDKGSNNRNVTNFKELFYNESSLNHIAIQVYGSAEQVH